MPFRMKMLGAKSDTRTFDLQKVLNKHKPIAIAFFATWCQPCAKELPLLEKEYRKHKGKLVVVGVSFDSPGSQSQVALFAKRLGLSFPVVHDADLSLAKYYDPQRAIPCLVLVDSKGTIVQTHAGWADSDYEEVPKKLARLVATQGHIAN